MVNEFGLRLPSDTLYPEYSFRRCERFQETQAPSCYHEMSTIAGYIPLRLNQCVKIGLPGIASHPSGVGSPGRPVRGYIKSTVFPFKVESVMFVPSVDGRDTFGMVEFTR